MTTAENNPCAAFNVLVVDDEPFVRELLCEMLVEEGLSAVAASGGEEALQFFQADKFDAVFTDIGLDGINGWELIKLIRQLDRQIPIVVVSGWGSEIGDEQLSAARANFLLPKPFTFESLTRIIAQIKSTSERN